MTERIRTGELTLTLVLSLKEGDSESIVGVLLRIDVTVSEAVELSRQCTRTIETAGPAERGSEEAIRGNERKRRDGGGGRGRRRGDSIRVPPVDGDVRREILRIIVTVDLRLRRQLASITLDPI